MDTTSSLGEFWRHRVIKREVTYSFEVGPERVTLKFKVPAHLARGLDTEALLNGKGPEALCELAEEVRLLIETASPERRRRSAVFSTREVVAILGGRWPDEENIVRIRRSILDRKAYPMPEYLPPPEKSFAAQGQTKKPGSHSESRHG